MSARPISSEQIRALQATRRRAGIDDDAWKARLSRFEVTSTKLLNADQAGALLDELRGGASAGSVRPQALTGPYATKARALWISLWNLGAIDDRRDSALLAWVERQTGMRSLSWVREHRDGVRVIEGLKDWLAREGVEWPVYTDPKRAVIGAIVDRLAIARDCPRLEAERLVLRQAGLAAEAWIGFCIDRDLDRLASAGGRALRLALAKKAG